MYKFNLQREWELHLLDYIIETPGPIKKAFQGMVQTHQQDKRTTTMLLKHQSDFIPYFNIILPQASRFNLQQLVIQYLQAETNAAIYLMQTEKTILNDPEFQQKWRDVKHQNKVDFARYVRERFGYPVNPNSLFDIQVKRMHEYKRQLLNVLHIVYLYTMIRQNRYNDFVPRTIFFAGKAAPGYAIAKLIIKLMTSVGHLVNNDPITRDLYGSSEIA